MLYLCSVKRKEDNNMNELSVIESKSSINNEILSFLKEKKINEYKLTHGLLIKNRNKLIIPTLVSVINGNIYVTYHEEKNKDDITKINLYKLSFYAIRSLAYIIVEEEILKKS